MTWRAFVVFIGPLYVLTAAPFVYGQPLTPEEFSRQIEEELQRLEEPPAAPPQRREEAAQPRKKDDVPGDTDGLKAAFEQGIAAFNAQDLDALATGWHERIIGSGFASPLPTVGKAALRQALQPVFANHEHLTFTPVNSQFHVVGDTGIVWCHYVYTRKPKNSPAIVVFGRQVATYVKAEGKWLLVAVDRSPIASEN
jgi:ketosteroid isomerase-like protein